MTDSRPAESIELYDTTLRDGAQGEGISFSAPGKIRVALLLDELGIDIIEGGYAASNPRDQAFFQDIRKESLKHSRIAAFGSTCRPQADAAKDPGVLAMLQAETPVVTLFGKSWMLHVRDVLKTTDEENVRMIGDTVSALKQQDRDVIYDAEHFFDGYKDDPDYAIRTLQAAVDAGADRIVLCDTNGGTLPHDVFEITKAVGQVLEAKIGIHTHNDSECAVANSLQAVHAGAMHIQGTINGFGERCGNANLCSIIPNLQLKLNRPCLPDPDRIRLLTKVADAVSELTNHRPDKKMPFIGASAFAHKAGMHVDGVRKTSSSFEHMDPAVVGNQRRILISELSGGSNVFLKAVEMGLEVDKSSPEVKEILRELENQEKQGYEFEAAEASFKMLIQKVLKAHKPFFDLEGFRVIVEKRSPDESCLSEATIKVSVDGETEHQVGEGDGPVDALNNALRQALTRFYPEIAKVFLTDYRVRILDPEEHTAAKTRVLIDSSDGHQNWSTVGVSENLIEASWEALVDSVEYKLFLDERAKQLENKGT